MATPRPAPARSAGVNGPIAEAAAALQELERQAESGEPEALRLIDSVFRVVGSLPFVAFHIIWFASWIALNLPGSPLAFDEFPFPVLVLVVSMEVIVLTLLILIAENRQSARDQHRDRVHLELNVLAEREITKVLEMLSEIHAELGIPHEQDSDLEAMHRPTRVEELVQAAAED